MTAKIVTLIGLSLIGVSANATNITINDTIDLGPTGLYNLGGRLIGPPGGNLIGSVFQIGFSNPLAGIPFNGETITLNIRFANDEFFRLYTATAKNMAGAGFSFDFPAGGVKVPDTFPYQIPGFSGKMSVLGLFGPKPMGVYTNALGDDLSSVGCGLGFRVSDFASFPRDIYGFKLILKVPNDFPGSFKNNSFAAMDFGTGPIKVFGVGPGISKDIVPDRGSTLVLLTFSLLGLMTFRQTRNS